MRGSCPCLLQCGDMDVATICQSRTLRHRNIGTAARHRLPCTTTVTLMSITKKKWDHGRRPQRGVKEGQERREDMICGPAVTCPKPPSKQPRWLNMNEFDHWVVEDFCFLSPMVKTKPGLQFVLSKMDFSKKKTYFTVLSHTIILHIYILFKYWYFQRAYMKQNSLNGIFNQFSNVMKMVHATHLPYIHI